MMAAMEEEDPTQVRAAQILVSLRFRKLRRWPEWVPMQPPGPASSSPGTVTTAAKVKVMPSGEASSTGSMQLGVASLAETVVARVPERWPRKGKRTGWRGETSRELEQGHAAAAAAAKGSDAPRSIEQEIRCAEMPATSAQRPPVAAALCYDAAVAGSGTGPTTSAVPAKESMKTPSPNSPLDYVAGGSGAPSTVEDAAPARPQAKRKGTGDDEGCSSPAKLGAVVAQEEKPVPISVEPSFTGKGAPLPFDLNLPPCSPDDDDDDCPDTT